MAENLPARILRRMDIDEYLEHLREEGQLLADSADGLDPGTEIPTCPEWCVRDLVRHVGGIHRWATAIVGGALTEPVDEPLIHVAGGWPDDTHLVEWFRIGHRTLVQTLADADPGLECWSFLPAPSPRLFWARRQTHETAIHRVDIQGAAAAISPIDPGEAADGIDELLTGFAARRRPWPWAEPRRLELHAPDAGRDWHVQIGPERVAVLEPGADDTKPDCVIEATASDLLQLLWNRVPAEALAVAGDPELLASWRDLVLVRWTD
jgi:uncharacterized protein (TIGR03083 family)